MTPKPMSFRRIWSNLENQDVYGFQFAQSSRYVNRILSTKSLSIYVSIQLFSRKVWLPFSADASFLLDYCLRCFWHGSVQAHDTAASLWEGICSQIQALFVFLYFVNLHCYSARLGRETSLLMWNLNALFLQSHLAKRLRTGQEAVSTRFMHWRIQLTLNHFTLIS